jgi:hypothetical protein
MYFLSLHLHKTFPFSYTESLFRFFYFKAGFSKVKSGFSQRRVRIFFESELQNMPKDKLIKFSFNLGDTSL